MRENQKAALRELVRTDSEAAQRLADLREEVTPLLAAQPNPLQQIHYEGLLNTDPRRIASVDALREMDAVAAALDYWQATGDEDAAAMLRRFVWAWASTYVPTGNDVNENKLDPVIKAYGALRESFDPEQRKTIDAWIERLGELHARAVRTATRFTNRYAKHVKLLAILGHVTGDTAWKEEAQKGARRLVQHALREDGTSLDLEERDTLTYHCSALLPVLEVALLAGKPQGPALYEFTAPGAGSIRRSVEYVVPYAEGSKTREEWRKTKVGLDRRRAEAGIEAYRPGRLFEPSRAVPMLELAAAFDASIDPLLLKLHGGHARRFASWPMVVAAAVRATDA